MAKKRTQITLTCPECGQKYLKDLSEYKRNEKLGRISYCSISCGTKVRNRIPEVRMKLLNYSKSQENIERLNKIKDNRIDEYTPFRMLLKTSRQRKNWENNLDLDYLKELWQTQKGICPYSGIKLKLPDYRTSNNIHPSIRASLDRIDSSIGYLKGNVQYISTLINYMKNTISHKETIDFINLLKQNKIDSSFDEDQTISSS